jgi:hypothetical protein
MKKWAEYTLANRLPLHVDEIKVYPDKMSLSTLQFTERLGYRQQSGIEMITMGCYNTLWAMRNHLENLKADELDEQDERSLRLAVRWMGLKDWPRLDRAGQDGPGMKTQLDALRTSWKCARKECVFHVRHCLHGAKMNKNGG